MCIGEEPFLGILGDFNLSSLIGMIGMVMMLNVLSTAECEAERQEMISKTIQKFG